MFGRICGTNAGKITLLYIVLKLCHSLVRLLCNDFVRLGKIEIDANDRAAIGKR